MSLGPATSRLLRTLPAIFPCLLLATWLAGCQPAVTAATLPPEVASATPAPPQPAPTASSSPLPPTPGAAPSPASPLPTAGPPPEEEILDGFWTSAVDDAQLVLIPAGRFRMGTLADFLGRQPDELPQHEVMLDAFWMDVLEVSWGQYQRCTDAGACPASLLGPPPPGQDDYPVWGVTWHAAEAYCAWAGRRLPTEAEWEKAARGTDARRYPWGWVGVAESSDGLRLNLCDSNCETDYHTVSIDDGYAEAAPVGSFPAGASPYGMLDMAGNLWEWTADWYDSRAYRGNDRTNPTGPENGRAKVIRGGSWLEAAWQGQLWNLRATNRAWMPPERGSVDLGFRCALSAASDD